MRAAVLKSVENIVIEEHEMPVIKNPDDVLVKVIQTGICGSDSQAYRGLHKAVHMPLILGHEFVARVIETGDAVKACKPGDLITAQPQKVCGTCYACRHGRVNICDHREFFGISMDGFFQDYVVISEFNVVRLPDDFPPEQGMLVEPFAVGANAAELAGAGPGKNIIVMGGGTIGNCAAQMATGMGARVLVMDIVDERLEYAKKCGIYATANSAKESIREAADRVFPEGADAILDCCGVRGMFEKMVEAAQNGSKIVIVAGYEFEIPLEMTKLQRREIELIGVMQYVRRHFDRVIDFMKTGKITTEGYVRASFPLEEINEGFKFMKEHPSESMKTAIILNKE